MSTERRAPPQPADRSTGKRGGCQRWTSEALFGGESIVVIEHAGQDYILRITRNGRLLLNKREGV